MNKVFDIIKSIYNSPFKPVIRLIMGLVIGVTAIWLAAEGYSLYKNVSTSRSPIVGIKATNNKLYIKDDKIAIKDFNIEAVHKNGDISSVDNKDIKLSTTSLALTGKTTEVTLTYKDKYTCTVEVKNERKKVASAECGKYEKGNVKAVLYSNGELAFEGEGDILQFHEKAAPWYTLETKDVSVTAVSFEETVTPKNLDFFFEGFSELVYIENVPSSIESAYRMCYKSTGLVEGPDFSNCENLLNLNQAFEGCIAMEKPAILPPNLTSALACYKGCVMLSEIGNIEDCAKLKISAEMYYGCENILKADFGPNLELIDNMYAGCINLEKANELPNSIKQMNYAFKDDISLKTVPNIPANAMGVSNAFSGCRKLEGEMVINAVPQNYSSFLYGACEGKKLDLKGSSPMLEVLANTTKSGNVTVNGKAPNPEKTSFDFYNYRKELEEAERQALEAEQTEEQPEAEVTE